MQPNDVTAWMLKEHEIIRELSVQLSKDVALPPRGDRTRWISDLRCRFDAFADHLRKHMATEEQGGYLLQVVEARPTLSDAVDAIKNEHRELTAIIGGLQEAIRGLAPVDNLLIRDCCKRVENLLTWIERHEEHENHIVLYALTQDLGSHD